MFLQEDSQLVGEVRPGHQEPGSMGSSPELRLPGRASAADHSHMQSRHQQALQHLAAGYGGQGEAQGLLGSVRSTGSEGHEAAGEGPRHCPAGATGGPELPWQPFPAEVPACYCCVPLLACRSLTTSRPMPLHTSCQQPIEAPCAGA